MYEDNKKCSNCTFDTTAIVTVNIDNWKYCPACGSQLRPEDYEDSEDDSNMKEIPISTPSEKDDPNDTQEDNSEDTENEDSGVEESESEDEVDEFIQKELERLKDRIGEED
jgi:uncharacterized Zn finger protein (UPF0148 family)